jgi:hypothetical protein
MMYKLLKKNGGGGGSGILINGRIKILGRSINLKNGIELLHSAGLPIMDEH